MVEIKRIIQKVVVLPILFYQKFIRPLKVPSCRFYPSCSQYMLDAIEHYGVIKGSFKGIYRILRCHPGSRGGFDSVFPVEEKK